MSLSPEDDFSAAEYALGTLDPGERAAIAARRQREPELDEAIRAWEERLSPLAEAVPPIEPPRDYLAEIEARIRARAARSPPNETVVALRARLARWRAAAIGAIGPGGDARDRRRLPARRPGETAPHEFVAVLQKSADSPAFAVTVNLDTRELTVRPVAAPAPSGKSYELWSSRLPSLAPRSLGVIGVTPRGDRARGLRSRRGRRTRLTL